MKQLIPMLAALLAPVAVAAPICANTTIGRYPVRAGQMVDTPIVTFPGKLCFTVGDDAKTAQFSLDDNQGGNIDSLILMQTETLYGDVMQWVADPSPTTHEILTIGLNTRLASVLVCVFDKRYCLQATIPLDVPAQKKQTIKSTKLTKETNI